jgi:hypothetical protein
MTTTEVVADGAWVRVGRFIFKDDEVTEYKSQNEAKLVMEAYADLLHDKRGEG